MSINMLLHEEINNFVESTTEHDIHAELDKMQFEFNKVNRLTRDLLHLIELGENLSIADKVALFDELHQVREERRYLKNILKFYMYRDVFSRLETNGTIGRGNKVYKPLENIYDASYGDDRCYALRTSMESGRLDDLVMGLKKWETKFSKIVFGKTNEELEEIRCRN